MRKKLGEIFVEDGIITKAQLKKVLKFQKKNLGMRFGEILISWDIIDKDILREYLQKQAEM